jgi:hypothetical protein
LKFRRDSKFQRKKPRFAAQLTPIEFFEILQLEPGGRIGGFQHPDADEFKNYFFAFGASQSEVRVLRSCLKVTVT